MNDGTPKLPFLFLVEGENTGPPANHVNNLSSIEYDMIFGFCSCYLGVYNMKGVLVSCQRLAYRIIIPKRRHVGSITAAAAAAATAASVCFVECFGSGRIGSSRRFDCQMVAKVFGASKKRCRKTRLNYEK